MLKHNVYIHIYENVTKTLQMHYRYVYIYMVPLKQTKTLLGKSITNT